MVEKFTMVSPFSKLEFINIQIIARKPMIIK